MATFNYERMYSTKSVLEARCKLNSADLTKLQIERDEQGIELLNLINVLVKHWKKTRELVEDGDLITMDKELKHEKVQKERIHNQTRLGHLIPKQEAKNRILTLLHKITEIHQGNIRQIAKERVSPHAEVIGPTTRAWIEYLTTKYNNLFDNIVEAEMSVKNWEDDGSAVLLRTRIESAKTDRDIDDIIYAQA